MASLLKVIFPTPETVELEAYIPTDFSLFMLIVPFLITPPVVIVLSITKFATAPDPFFAYIPTDLSPFTVIFPV